MKPVITAFLFFLSVSAKAQQTYYLYIQSENKQQFYIRMDKDIYSSAGSGYVIISKLLDSTYSFSIGFPKNQWPQQSFICAVNKKDNGYLLKNFGDKGWGLFDLQTMAITMANMPAENKNIIREERTDSFSNMLSAVVDDPGIKEVKKAKPVAVLDTTQPVETVKPEVVADEPKKEIPDGAVVISTMETKKIIKLLDKANKDGRELIYIDNTVIPNDTIRIFIPADKISASVQEKKQDDTIAPAEVKPEKQVMKNDEKKFINVEMPVTPKTDTPVQSNNAAVIPASAEKIKTAPVVPVKQNTVLTNSNCKSIASDEEFLRLRKKMASTESDDDMISLAKKVFKTKCFTTSQVKNLGFLFLNDQGRYKFFDMAYSFISDPENFGSLQNQLSDPYYVNRFKAMVSH
jgi:hypothetical protein